MPESASSLTALFAAELASKRQKASSSSTGADLSRPIKKLPYAERSSKGANKGVARRRGQDEGREVDLDKGKGLALTRRQEEDRARAAQQRKCRAAEEQRQNELVDSANRPPDHYDPYAPSSPSSDSDTSLNRDDDPDPDGYPDPDAHRPHRPLPSAHASSSHTALPTSFDGRVTAQDPRDQPRYGDAVPEDEHLYVDEHGRERYLRMRQIQEMGLVQDEEGIWREPVVLDPQRNPGTFGQTESGRHLKDQSSIRGEQSEYHVYHASAEDLKRRQEKHQPRQAPGVRSGEDGSTHYDRSTDNRAQGAGAMNFSVDEKERQMQQARIKAEHERVEAVRAEAGNKRARIVSAAEDRKAMLEAKRREHAAKRAARVAPAAS